MTHGPYHKKGKQCKSYADYLSTEVKKGNLSIKDLEIEGHYDLLLAEGTVRKVKSALKNDV